VGLSGSYDKDYEIAEFDRVPGQTYKTNIRFIPGDNWTWNGITWTVV